MVRNPVDYLRVAALLATFGWLAHSGAAAAPRSIADCETIKQADAYNMCLASFGPPAHTGPAVGETPAASGEQAAVPAKADKDASRGRWSRHRHERSHSAARGHGRGRSHAAVTRHGGGRVRASFDVRSR